MGNKIKKTWKFKFFGCSKCSRHEGRGLKHFDIISILMLYIILMIIALICSELSNRTILKTMIQSRELSIYVFILLIQLKLIKMEGIGKAIKYVLV